MLEKPPIPPKSNIHVSSFLKKVSFEKIGSNAISFSILSTIAIIIIISVIASTIAKCGTIDSNILENSKEELNKTIKKYSVVQLNVDIQSGDNYYHRGTCGVVEEIGEEKTSLILLNKNLPLYIKDQIEVSYNNKEEGKKIKKELNIVDLTPDRLNKEKFITPIANSPAFLFKSVFSNPQDFLIFAFGSKELININNEDIVSLPLVWQATAARIIVFDVVPYFIFILIIAFLIMNHFSSAYTEKINDMYSLYNKNRNKINMVRSQIKEKDGLYVEFQRAKDGLSYQRGHKSWVNSIILVHHVLESVFNLLDNVLKVNTLEEKIISLDDDFLTNKDDLLKAVKFIEKVKAEKEDDIDSIVYTYEDFTKAVLVIEESLKNFGLIIK